MPDSVDGDQHSALHQADSPALAALDDTLSPPAKRKKTAQGSSSRGVANLTPEQLARKRANDREAQRAIRERTKNQIDTLNARIRELESAQPYHDLQQAIRQKDAVQAENEDIKRRLATVMSIIQPLLGNQGLNELAAAAERNALPIQPNLGDPNSLTDGSAYQPPMSAMAPMGPGQGGQAVDPADASQAGREWHMGESPPGHLKDWAGNASSYDPQLQFAHSSDERLGVDFLLDGTQRPLQFQNGLAAPQAPAQAGASPRPDMGQQAVWEMLPKFVEPTCQLDRALSDFLIEHTRLRAEGVDADAVVGPRYPNFDLLVEPEQEHGEHALSKLFTRLLRAFPTIDRLPEQAAILYVMFLVMRWMVAPTRDNYERIPAWIQPRPSQLFTPYPHWLTYLPWPQMRDRLVQNSGPPFDIFFIPYCNTVSVNWPYEARHCLIPNPQHAQQASGVVGGVQATQQQSPRSTRRNSKEPASSSPPLSQPRYIMNPAFESHLRDLSNWSLGPAFREAFPQLADTCRIKEGGR